MLLEVSQGMQRKANFGAEAELTQVSAASRPRILSRNLTPRCTLQRLLN